MELWHTWNAAQTCYSIGTSGQCFAVGRALDVKLLEAGVHLQIWSIDEVAVAPQLQARQACASRKGCRQLKLGTR